MKQNILLVKSYKFSTPFPILFQFQLSHIFAICFFSLNRDGVSESQFTQVLNIELDQIIEALLWTKQFAIRETTNFYMCSHAGMIGTTCPTHYHVLLDEIGFSPDDLYELAHSLSYVYQRSTTAISIRLF
ncbi:protein argonaute 4B-like isoform X2 [Magnolia sinica]|uniref:protein argonaute 4B-like isoform X2 n=1 Tax=Magnolia sinica TaxID=86752 RepID=UPI00265B3DF8|nr:protein argonaute 4B-like isoform X2 [Magnolia sinica]